MLTDHSKSLSQHNGEVIIMQHILLLLFLIIISAHVYTKSITLHLLFSLKCKQRYGDGPSDELALESSGDYTRKIGHLEFSDYSNETKNGKPVGNFLNNVWYQPEEIFSIDGTPEVRQHAFWVPVNKHYFTVAKKLKVKYLIETMFKLLSIFALISC
jgi:hypothetical protein